jgi:AcrR family transcriptional regulator
MVEVASELGYLGAAVAPVVARAGVSRRTFYELFEGREDCFLAAFNWAVEQLCEVTVKTYRSHSPWREGVRHGLARLLALLDSEPELARVAVIEALGAGAIVLERRAEVAAQLIAGLAADAPQGRSSPEMPLLTAEGVVGAVFSVIHARLLELPGPWMRGTSQSSRSRDVQARGDRGPLMGLHGQLMVLIVLPYLGPRAAKEELKRPMPIVMDRERTPDGKDIGRLLERLDTRLTYRTVRCLVFIREHPGTSNREVAQGAEVPDEGQASKLLGRLERLGLLVNGRPHGPGFPNRWTLTAHGEQVLSSVNRY